jgi:TPR repeat protein
LLRIGDIWFLLIIVFISLLLKTGSVSAGQKEFGNQNNIYITEWARLRHQAELGDPDALFVLGNYYFKPPRGSSFRKNLNKSAEYYFQSAIRKNAAAQYNFAFMLHKGLGVQQNTLESYVWFKIASLNPSPVAKHVNQLSRDVVATLELDMDKAQIELANQKLKEYQENIDKKRYRQLKYPD